jgi:polygalacturonase
MHLLPVVALTASLAVSAAAAPASATIPASQVDKRAAAAISSQAACSTIILNNVVVPAGTTLDLSKLADGATVIFQGTTTWGYREWVGPLLNIGGKKITVQGASGAVLDPNGSRWWDGKGGNGGKTKPKVCKPSQAITVPLI